MDHRQRGSAFSVDVAAALRCCMRYTLRIAQLRSKERTGLDLAGRPPH